MSSDSLVEYVTERLISNQKPMPLKGAPKFIKRIFQFIQNMNIFIFPKAGGIKFIYWKLPS